MYNFVVGPLTRMRGQCENGVDPISKNGRNLLGESKIFLQISDLTKVAKTITALTVLFRYDVCFMIHAF